MSRLTRTGVVPTHRGTPGTGSLGGHTFIGGAVGALGEGGYID